MTGAGHGTAFFYVLSESPFGMGLFLWPLVGTLVPFMQIRTVRLLVGACLLVHYICILILCVQWADYYPMYTLGKTLRSMPLEAASVGLIYLSGQAFLWRELVLGKTQLHITRRQ